MQPTLTTLARTFLAIGLMSFGGPAAQIALMHRILVDDRRWLTERQYLDALGFCMLLPGPEAMQLCTWCGWRLRGWRGGLIAGGLFVAPGALLILALAAAYVAYGDLPAVQTAFVGIKAAVLVVVAQALAKLARRALTTGTHIAIAVLSFAAIFFLDIPFPAIVAAAALWGALVAGGAPSPVRPADASVTRTVVILAVGATLWLAPFAVLDGRLAEIGAFFSRLALVSFGGAYAGLAYMAQDLVAVQGWLTPEQMVDALGLAETTPGPLILVTQFAGYLAAAPLGPGPAVAAAALTLWVTFVPSFAWIFAFAPWIDRIAAAPRLAGALAGITAAVVGVVANLSLWFALHTLFGTVTRETVGPLVLQTPALATLDWRVLPLAALAWLILTRAPLPFTLLACAATALILP